MGLWDSIKQIAGNTVDVVGTTLHLPEMGLSEATAGNKTTVATGAKPLATYNTYGKENAGMTPMGQTGQGTGTGQNVQLVKVPTGAAPGTSVATPAVTNKTTVNANVGSGGGGATSTSQVAGSANQLAANATSQQEQYAAAQAQKAAEDKARLEEQTRSDINAEYEPVFAELDRRLGSLPGQKQADEDFISGSAADQASQIALQKDQSTKEATGNAAKTVRDLEENTNNLINAQLMRLGAGADGSAGLYGSEIITRAGTRERGNVLNQRDQILSNISNIANQEANKIETWKKTKLYEATQFYNSKIDEISGQKAQAGSDKARALTELRKGLATDYINRVRELDDQVSSWKSGIQQWQIERQSSLEDAKSSIGSAGSTKLSFKTLPDGSVVGLNPYTGEQVSTTGGLAGLNLNRTGKDPYADDEED